MSKDGFYRRSEDSNTEDYKANLLVREGYMTTRQGYPGVELGYPTVVREDLPEYRSRDGSQLGPVFMNPRAPWHAHENTKGQYYPRHHAAHSKAIGHGHMKLNPRHQDEILAKNDSFKNGHYYPYKRNYNMHYEELPQAHWSQPLGDPSNFAHKSDDLRKWLLGLR